MAILEKEVWVTVNPANSTHYEKLGYEIPKRKDKRDRWVTPKGTKLLVKIEDLPNRSNMKLTKICDDCAKQIPNQTIYNISRMRLKTDGKDRCQKCGNIRLGKISKDNPLYENSLEYFALNNGMEHLLSEFSENNTKKPSSISYGSNYVYLWNCPRCKTEYDTLVSLRTVQKSYPFSFILEFYNYISILIKNVIIA